MMLYGLNESIFHETVLRDSETIDYKLNVLLIDIICQGNLKVKQDKSKLQYH